MKRFRLKKEINLTGLLDTDSRYDRYMSGKSKKGEKSPQEKLGIEDQGMEPLGGKPMRLKDVLSTILGSMYEEE